MSYSFTKHCVKYATTKTLSPQLMNMSPKQTKFFLDSYFASDRNISERENSLMILFSTASETLALQMQMLLNKLHIQAYIQVRERREAYLHTKTH